ncbi:hypothetical protein BVI434_3020026 [Burkholderia vietnamiensis]|nr:hypothetical protein BVI434_3020026 [Burkholderia vietnamiensis]
MLSWGLSVAAACPVCGRAAFRTRAGLRHAHAYLRDADHGAARRATHGGASRCGRTNGSARAQDEHARAAGTFSIVDGFAGFLLRPNGRSRPRRSIGLTANFASNGARRSTVTASEPQLSL